MFEDIRPTDEYRVDIYGEAAGWPKSKFPELCYRYKDGFKYITIDPQIMNEFKETIKGNEIPKLLETIKSLPQYDGRDFRVDISMSRIRRDIDRACEAGRQYTIIPRTGDNYVDAAICTTMEAEGYKVARNQNKILISWY